MASATVPGASFVLWTFRRALLPFARRALSVHQANNLENFEKRPSQTIVNPFRRISDTSQIAAINDADGNPSFPCRHHTVSAP